jgi:hypothetical protein
MGFNAIWEEMGVNIDATGGITLHPALTETNASSLRPLSNADESRSISSASTAINTIRSPTALPGEFHQSVQTSSVPFLCLQSYRFGYRASTSIGEMISIRSDVGSMRIGERCCLAVAASYNLEY